MLKLLRTAHWKGRQSCVQHIVHHPRNPFYELDCLGMQSKMGGKLLFTLNIGTRQIGSKYREGKMKSTLKRKLIVRETIKREAHGILFSYRHCTDPNGPSVHIFWSELSHFSAVCINSYWNWVIRPARR